MSNSSIFFLFFHTPFPFCSQEGTKLIARDFVMSLALFPKRAEILDKVKEKFPTLTDVHLEEVLKEVGIHICHIFPHFPTFATFATFSTFSTFSTFFLTI